MLDQYGKIEKSLLRQNKVIAGVDEVGKGALAGPVYAGAVILNYAKLSSLDKEKRAFIRDSKALSPSQRKTALSYIPEISDAYATGFADLEEINEIGIQKASFLAMQRALSKLSRFDILLIDGKFPIPDYKHEQMAVIGGDASCYAIAAASILAKETRDHLMKNLGEEFTPYGFAQHVGYATRKHLDAIKNFGPCSIHRKGFEPIKSMLQNSQVT